jgi:uncharacterized protein (TIGR03067 family)
MHDTTSPNLRWYQYRLWTVLLLVFACSLALVWWRWSVYGVPDPLRPVKEELRDNARRGYEIARAQWELNAGGSSYDEIHRWSKAWMEAERALSTNRDEDARAIREYFQRTQEHCDRIGERGELAKAAYWLTEAELLLAQADPREQSQFVQTSAVRRRLQGTWKVKSHTLGGKAVTEKYCDSITVQDRIADVDKSYGLLSVDPLSVPSTFEIRALMEDAPFDLKGTYRLDGDTWVITLADGRVITLERSNIELPPDATR